MTHPIQESDRLSRFTAEPARFLERLRQSGEPILLRAEDGSEVVVQDAESFRRLLEQMDQLEALAGIREGMNDAANGRTRPMREALEELARKHRLSNPTKE